MQLFLANALFAAAGLAMPAGSFSCPGGLTNSSPACCSTNVLGVVSLDCKAPSSNGCSDSLKPNCCTLLLAQQGILCNPV